jgi:hypothetical protein
MSRFSENKRIWFYDEQADKMQRREHPQSSARRRQITHITTPNIRGKMKKKHSEEKMHPMLHGHLSHGSKTALKETEGRKMTAMSGMPKKKKEKKKTKK